MLKAKGLSSFYCGEETKTSIVSKRLFLVTTVSNTFKYTDKNKEKGSVSPEFVSLSKYTQQIKLRKLCLRGYDKRSETF